MRKKEFYSTNFLFRGMHTHVSSWYCHNCASKTDREERKNIFTQQQNMVVSPVFESLTRLRSNTVRLVIYGHDNSIL